MDTHHAGIRILHLVSSTDRRGAETAAVELSDALTSHGLVGDVAALTPGEQGGLDLPVLGHSRLDLGGLRNLRELAAQASLVLAHGSSTLLATATATLGLGTPFVYRSIGDPEAWLTTPARRARVGWAVKRASGLVALWRGAAVTWHRTLNLRAERITVIPNGISVERFRPPNSIERQAARAAIGLPENGPVVMYLGALSREKRIERAIHAVRLMNGVILAVVGEGPERVRLAAMADDSGGMVRLLGPTREPWKALAAADAVVLPSDTEGQPAVAIEAGLMGIPVVATRVGGVSEIVLDGRTGHLVTPGDIAGLQAALAAVLAAPDTYGGHARDHCVQGFAIDRVAEKWTIFLQSVIKMGAIPEQHCV